MASGRKRSTAALSMKILIDMNISPDLVKVLNNSYAILTHDLDFGTILAVSQALAPSVIQIRTQNLLSSDFKTLLINRPLA